MNEEEKSSQTQNQQVHSQLTKSDSRQGSNIVQAVHYEGPLPPAAELERYNSIVPGCATILIDMAVKNSEHRMLMDSRRMELSKKALDGDLEHTKQRDAEARRGQYFAFILGLIALILAGVLIYLDHPVFGTVIGGVPFFGFLTAFILGRTKEHK